MPISSACSQIGLQEHIQCFLPFCRFAQTYQLEAARASTFIICFYRIDYGINISSDNIKPRGFDQPEFRDTVKTLCQCFYVSGSEFFSYYSFPFDNKFFIITPPKKRHVAPYPNQIPAFPYQLVNSSTCSSDP